MINRLSAICVTAAAVSMFTGVPATATDISAAKQVTGIYCDNGIAPSVVVTVRKNGTIKFTTGDAMVGVADSQIVVDLGHGTTVQVFATTKAGTTEQTYYGAPQSVVFLPFDGTNTQVSVC